MVIRTHTHDKENGGQASGEGPVSRPLDQESGQGLVEYGLIALLAALLSVAVVVAILAFPPLGDGNKTKDICLKAGYPGYEYSPVSNTYYCTSANGAVPISAVQG